ncbi:hypothetical protein FB451DRAFT_1168147 [Mycena latifolia]|nr:hypothetical protein FB451DRAFT_1168147 [Mycena latifolia]
MAGSASFSILPPELVDEIVQWASQSDIQIYLHFVASTGAFMKSVYPTSKAQSCCTRQALNSGPGISELVKTLRVNCHEEVFAPPHKRHVPPQFLVNDSAVREACGAAIEGLKRLVSLEIIRPCFSPHLPKFLQDHPRIESLSIDVMETNAQFHAQIPQIRLPALRAFTGPELVARAIIAGAAVPSPTIFWPPPPPMRQTPAAATIARLALAATPITELHNEVDGWDTPDPRALARALPALTVLTFLNLRREEARGSAFLIALTAALPNCTTSPRSRSSSTVHVR